MAAAEDLAERYLRGGCRKLLQLTSQGAPGPGQDALAFKGALQSAVFTIAASMLGLMSRLADFPFHQGSGHSISIFGATGTRDCHCSLCCPCCHRKGTSTCRSCQPSLLMHHDHGFVD